MSINGLEKSNYIMIFQLFQGLENEDDTLRINDKTLFIYLLMLQHSLNNSK